MPFTPVAGPFLNIEEVSWSNLVHTYSIAYSTTDNTFLVCYIDSAAGTYFYGYSKLYKTTEDSDVITEVGSMASFEPTANNARKNVSCIYDPANDAFVVFYGNSGNDMYAVVGKLGSGGTSISWGTRVSFGHVGASKVSLSVSNGRILCCHSGTDTILKVGTISGMSISFGSSETILAGYCGYSDIVSLSSGKFLVGYLSSTTTRLLIANVSGAVVSPGSPVVVSSLFTDTLSICRDPNSENIIIAGRVSSGDNLFSYSVLDDAISLTDSISVDISPQANDRIELCYDENTKTTCLVCDSDGDTRALSIETSSSTPVVVTNGIINADFPYFMQSIYDPTSKMIFTVWGTYYGPHKVFLYIADDPAPVPFWTNFSGQTETVI